MTTASTAPPPTPPDRVARQLIGAFLTGVALVLPLLVTLSVETDGRFHFTLLLAMAGVLVFGWLLARIGVPDGIALAAATAGAYAVAVIVVLRILPSLGTPGDNTQVALFAGILGAAVAAPVATAIVQWPLDAIGARGVAATACALGFIIAIGAGPVVQDGILQARHDAEVAEQLEDSGLRPLLPSIDGFAVEYSGRSFSTGEAGSRTTGYSLRYEPEDAPSPALTSYISVDVSFAEEPACDPASTFETCEDHSTYTIIERDGVVDSVVADKSGVRLEARFYDNGEELPDAETVGEALADAEEVEWLDLASAEND